MRSSYTKVGVAAKLLTVGSETVPVYGDDESGWSVDPGDLYPATPVAYRFRSVDELYFALLNLKLCPEGRA